MCKLNIVKGNAARKESTNRSSGSLSHDQQPLTAHDSDDLSATFSVEELAPPTGSAGLAEQVELELELEGDSDGGNQPAVATVTVEV